MAGVESFNFFTVRAVQGHTHTQPSIHTPLLSFPRTKRLWLEPGYFLAPILPHLVLRLKILGVMPYLPLMSFYFGACFSKGTSLIFLYLTSGWWLLLGTFLAVIYYLISQIYCKDLRFKGIKFYPPTPNLYFKSARGSPHGAVAWQRNPFENTKRCYLRNRFRRLFHWDAEVTSSNVTKR